MTMLLLVALLVIVPALIGLLLISQRSSNRAQAADAKFGIGAPIIYQQQEVSTHPGPDAHDIRPAARGDYYYYNIINYLRVADVLSDGRIVAINRTQTQHYLRATDTNLRKPSLIERIIYRPRFPRLA